MGKRNVLNISLRIAGVLFLSLGELSWAQSWKETEKTKKFADQRTNAQPATAEAEKDKDNDEDPQFKGLKYRLLGPFRGGRSLTASGVPGDPNTYYFGGTGGGVWKS